MAPIKCFLLVPTEKCRRYLRRYSRGYGEPSVCKINGSYHNAMTFFEEIREIKGAEAWEKIGGSADPPRWDPRWPIRCECGYLFGTADEFQVFDEHLWKRTDTGEEMTLRDAPDGAMWDAYWFHEQKEWCGEDGLSIICKVPFGHEWMIDGKASNCTMPGDTVHRCWVRHGVPPNLTVDKNGKTCKAGAGSIQAPKWHGFLRNGMLVP